MRKFKQKVTVIVEVSPTAQTGDAGVLEVVVFSQENAADRTSGRIILNLEVQTIYDIQFSNDVELYHQIEYPNKQTIPVNIVNNGNTRTEFISTLQKVSVVGRYSLKKIIANAGNSMKT